MTRLAARTASEAKDWKTLAAEDDGQALSSVLLVRSVGTLLPTARELLKAMRL